MNFNEFKERDYLNIIYTLYVDHDQEKGPEVLLTELRSLKENLEEERQEKLVDLVSKYQEYGFNEGIKFILKYMRLM